MATLEELTDPYIHTLRPVPPAGPGVTDIPVWEAVSDRLARYQDRGGHQRGEVAAVPWELLRDPATDAVLALRARAFVRADPHTPRTPVLPELTGDGAGAVDVVVW